MVQTYSGAQAIPARHKIREWFELSVMAARSPSDTSGILNNLSEYDSYLRKYTEESLASARVMEFGFGARPLRQMALAHVAAEAYGVDRDRPEGEGGISDYWRICRENGLERALKTAGRKLLVGDQHRRALAVALQELTTRPVDNRLNLATADLSSPAALQDLPVGSFDLVLSEDVFEHIPATGVSVAISHAARLLKPTGLALIRPNVFTGIMGGHLPEWYGHKVDQQPKRSEPWEHLRQRRYKANTYLNELSRAEFRSIFESSFQILEEVVKIQDLGAKYLTPSVRDELHAYPDEELFSNQVMWVMRKK